jgi:hypothetical protein
VTGNSSAVCRNPRLFTDSSEEQQGERTGEDKSKVRRRVQTADDLPVKVFRLLPDRPWCVFLDRRMLIPVKLVTEQHADWLFQFPAKSGDLNSANCVNRSICIE